MAQQTPVDDCTEFAAAEGRYTLQQDFFLDQVLPHSVIPTFVSSVSVKYKDYFSGSHHGKGDVLLSAANLDRLDEHLRDLKASDDKDGDEEDPSSSMTGNFHGALVDIPLDSTASGYRSPGTNGLMSPLPQVTTPGPPPLKDSTSSNRLSEQLLYQLNFNNTATNTTNSQPATTLPQHASTFPSSKSMGRAGGLSQSLMPQDEAQLQPTTPSAGFSSFFSGKRKKPKNNIAKTNSTFMAKITTHENLARILANRVGEDVYVFWNTGRTFTWSDLGQKSNEPLSHISFTKAFPTYHDVNVLTRSCDSLDVIIGFSTGDIIWFDPLCNKYYRLNKQSTIKDSAVTMIKWMPGSESQFMASFQDGTIVIMDKERDDSSFTPSTPPNEAFHVTRPKHSKYNPITHWNVCSKPITAFAFSPDLQHVAVVAADGVMRIIDFVHERLIETFQSYFGALSCVSWSPDGKYILTGGQDDLVTIWSFKDLKIIARCQGHQSYVTGVAFDPWRCDERNYRFGSVGEDAKLLLWDFSVSALHKPKARRGSNGTTHGQGSFKPGHGSKESITSLRGVGGHSLFDVKHTIKALSQTTLKEEDNPSSPPSTMRSGDERERLDHHPKKGPMNESTSSLLVGRRGSEQRSSINSNSSSTTNVATATGESQHGADLSHTSPRVSSEQQPHHQQPQQNAYKKASKTMPRLYTSSNPPSQPSNNTLSSLFQFGSTSSNNGPHHTSHPSQQSVHHQHHPHAARPGRDSIDASTTNPFQVDHLHHHSSGVHGTRPVEPRARVAMLQPVMAKIVHCEPLASVTFREDVIMTSDRRGSIKVWKRPQAPLATL
ncbi:MAG: WD40-repeat-containing domain protein [Podila humilis]|nr:MAG: WD40-repeat-containing domain protein [Podila humilis]